MQKTLSILLFLAFNVYAFAAGNNWELSKDKNGIKVYSKIVPGQDIKSFKSVMMIDGSLSSITGLMMDISAFPKWIYRCSNANVLKRISESELIYYQETSVPWPAANRDCISSLKASQDKRTGIVTIIAENMPDYIPRKPGIVRLPKFSERVTIVPKGNNKCEFSYEITVNPGGNIPAWMINLAASTGPYESSANMVKLFQTGAYKFSVYSFIENR